MAIRKMSKEFKVAVTIHTIQFKNDMLRVNLGSTVNPSGAKAVIFNQTVQNDLSGNIFDQKPVVLIGKIFCRSGLFIFGIQDKRPCDYRVLQYLLAHIRKNWFRTRSYNCIFVFDLKGLMKCRIRMMQMISEFFKYPNGV